MSQQLHEPGDGLTMAGSLNGAHALAYAHSLSCTVFLRTSFGREGIGMHGLITMLMILGYGCAMQCLAMFPFFAVWFLAVCCQRIRRWLDERRGVIVHSRYNGYPWLSKRLFPRISELNAKGIDAFICLFVGGVIAHFDKPFGWFVAAGFLSIMFTEGMNVEGTKRRLRAMRDMELEQQYLSDAYRSGRF